jgi:hypothetical protein
LNWWLARAVCIVFILSTQPQILLAAPQAVAAGAVTITPAKLEFDAQPVSTSGSLKVITLLNSGAAPMTITDVLTSGIDFSQSSHCGATLAPGASCTIEVGFKPAITGPRLGTLIIACSDPGSPHIFALGGIGK